MTFDMFKHQTAIALASESVSNGKIFDLNGAGIKADSYTNSHWHIIKKTDIKRTMSNISVNH